MLKRFMTWLLNQFQKVLGSLSGKRSSKQAMTSATHTPEKSNPSVPGTSFSDVTVAERLPFVPPVEVSSSNSASTEGDGSALSTPALKERVVSTQRVDVDKDAVGTDVAMEPAISNQVDIASASVPGVAEEEPKFPTEVSELLSAETDQNAELPVHPLKKLSDEQLPVIHDLLPAVEPIEVDSASSGIECSEDAELLQDSESSADIDQPVLFSFDIVESGEGDENEETSPISDDASPTEHNVVHSELGKAVDISLKEGLDDSVDNLNESAEIPVLLSSQDAPSLENSLLENSADNASEAMSSDVGMHQQTTAVGDENSTKLLDVKNGTVKLLFTMKPGNFHGYIAPDDGSKDILFHQKYINADIFTQLERGAEVSATVKYIEGKAYATHVDLR